MFSIEKMGLSHLDEVYEIELASFSIPWTKASIKKEIENDKLSIYIIAKNDGKVVGYAGMWHVVTEGHITNVAVSPEYRSRGIGDLLIKRLIEIGYEKEMIGLTLEVRMNNVPAQRIYFKNGFKPEGIRKNYYVDTKEDAIVMWKTLE